MSVELAHPAPPVSPLDAASVARPSQARPDAAAAAGAAVVDLSPTAQRLTETDTPSETDPVVAARVPSDVSFDDATADELAALARQLRREALAPPSVDFSELVEAQRATRLAERARIASALEDEIAEPAAPESRRAAETYARHLD